MPPRGTPQAKRSALGLLGGWLASVRDGHSSELTSASCRLRTPLLIPDALSLLCSCVDGGPEIVLPHKRPSSDKKTKLSTDAIWKHLCKSRLPGLRSETRRTSLLMNLLCSWSRNPEGGVSSLFPEPRTPFPVGSHMPGHTEDPA